ncbi:MAG: hypothetical protein Q4C95_11230 [Planctomycetia bacterium]|nr:hypothetical protein [Planctomycetia bacterium]
MSFTGIHPNALSEQAPSSEWTVVIDETGSEFSKDAYTANKTKVGRIVGIFIPKETVLPELPKEWHANELSLSEIESVVKRIQTSKCGVLGVSVNAFPQVHADQWFAGIEILLELALHLLPITEQTTFNIFVEKRGEFDCKMSSVLQKTCDDVLNRFRRVHPDLAQKLVLNGSIISKEGHSYNGYADAAAFVWGGSTAQKILKASRWLDTCFLGQLKYSLCDILELMEHEKSITPEMWTDLVTNQAAASDNSFVSALLRKLGEYAQGDVEKWRLYMNHTVRHLDSKAINMYILGRQLKWLKAYVPDDEKFLPRLRLLWLTVNLAEKNHRGETGFEEFQKEFHSLSEQLYEEDAPLVCNANLHLAVALTNNYDFNGAARLMDKWHSVPIETPGRQLYGRLLSTFGQHNAFLGHNEKACVDFRNAIKTFEKLSDPNESKLDISQTRAYLVNVLMDSGEKNVSELMNEFSLYFGGTLEEAAEKLSSSNDSGEKYAHHLLLRYLVSNRTEVSQKARAIYLDHRSNWKSGEGHPWEMIEFYRGLLLTDPLEQANLFRKAHEIVKNEGATLQVIDAVLLGSLLTLDSEVEDEYRQKVEQLKTSMPRLEERLTVLIDQPSKKRSPLELAAAVLPFNFR